MDVIAIDQQGGKGNCCTAENVMPTLCSDSHGTPHAICFAWANSAMIGISAGYVAPTIKASRCGEPAVVIGFDVYNMASTGSVAKTLNSAATDTDHIPVICSNDQRMFHVESMGHDERSTQFGSDGCCDTLLQSDYKQPIIVCYDASEVSGIQEE